MMATDDAYFVRRSSPRLDTNVSHTFDPSMAHRAAEETDEVYGVAL